MLKYLLPLLVASACFAQTTLQGTATGLPSAADGSFALRFRERYVNATTTKYIGLKAPDDVTTNTTLVLPDGGGTAGHCVKTSGGTGTVNLFTGFCDTLWELHTSPDAVISVRPSAGQPAQLDTLRFSDAGTSSDVDGTWKEKADISSGNSRWRLIDSANVEILRATSLSGGSSVYELTVNSDFIPPTDDYGKVGKTGGRFHEVHVNTLYMDACVGTGCGSGGLPVVDTTSLVFGSSDATKLLRFEVDGFTTGTTRVLTPQNASYILAAQDFDNAFTTLQTSALGFAGINSSNNGSVTGNFVQIKSGLAGGVYKFLQPAANTMRLLAPDGTTVVMDIDNDGVGVDTFGVRGHFFPTTSATFDLGVTGALWRTLNMNGNITVNGVTFLTGATLTLNTGNIATTAPGIAIGTSGNPYQTLYATDHYIGTMQPFTGTSSTITLNANIIPTATYFLTPFDLGSASKLLNFVYTHSLYMDVCTGPGCGGASLWTDGGATTYLTATGDNLCIGCTSTSTKLEVSGGVTLSGNLLCATDGGCNMGNTTSNRFVALNVTDNLRVWDGAGSSINRVSITAPFSTYATAAGTGVASINHNNGAIWSSGGFFVGSGVTAGISVGPTPGGCRWILGILVTSCAALAAL